MAEDGNGKDVSLVAVAITGRAYIAPASTAIPTPEEGSAAEVTLADAFKSLGLRTEDGAPEWKEEADGDPIVFFEDGYQIPTGGSNVTCTMTLAQTMPLVDELRSGAVYDEYSHTVIDAGGNTKSYVLWTEVAYKSPAGELFLERRCAPNVTVNSVVDAKEERGKVRGYTVEFKANRFGDGHYHKWMLLPDVPVEPDAAPPAGGDDDENP